ncbi:DNA topoisomerase [Flavobacterium sp.]|uniref:type IA DNA topoisomerase n=1 Tax=Flavobacterium sp. TaxID=239 RepID=UPI003A94522E
MKTVIAEKPSVAREIAVLLGANQKKEGYFQGSGYFITWALGHLISLGMPEDYGFKGFDKERLPVLPHPFLLCPRKIKKDKGYVTNTKALKQLRVIEKLFNQSSSIIVATDAGREGELIFRYIYHYLKCSKPFRRLWISSLTEKAIIKGFENLKSGKEYDALYRAAQARSHADWLVGINASQALSISVGDGIYSLGRVQTPTLALLCKRYLENKSFKSRDYWQITLEHQKGFVYCNSLSDTQWDNQKAAEKALRSIERNKTAVVGSSETNKITEQPPLLFDLTGLQKQANKALGFSAGETLSIAQSLYEKKFISYPRTGSRHITEDLWLEIPTLIRGLEDRETCRDCLSQLKWGGFNKRVVNDVKVSDHHGLLITSKIPSALSAKENAIYDMIALRLLEAVSEPCLKELTTVSLQVLHYDFSLKGSKVIQPGWRAIRGNFFVAENQGSEELPELKVGDELKIRDAQILKKQTHPPALYTEAGILSAMESAGKTIEDKQERLALQNIGIGTPATRAAIIETLFSRNYIRREKKFLIPTAKGLQVYELVKDKKIADVTLTAQWERALQEIENNKSDAVTFQKKVETFTKAITQELLQAGIHRTTLPKLTCPKCKKEQLFYRENSIRCPGRDCNWVQYRRVCGVQLSISDIEKLIKNGKTDLIKGMKSKSGKTFNAYIVLNEKAESHFEFENNKSKGR